MDPPLTISFLRFMDDVIDYLEPLELTPGKSTTLGYYLAEAISEKTLRLAHLVSH